MQSLFSFSTLPPEQVTRQILGNVPGWLQVVFYALTATAFAAAAVGFVRRNLLRRRGHKPDPADEPSRSLPAKVGSVIVYLTFHKQLLRDRYAGLAHLLMFYGFFILFIGTCMVAVEHYHIAHFFYGPFYQVASLILDLGGMAFVVGLTMFLFRRLSDGAPDNARILERWWVDAMAWLLLGIGFTGFLLEGARIARDLPDFERWSIVGYVLALILRGVGLSGDASLPWHRALWSTHAAMCIAFFALLPWRFFGHITYSAMSWATRTRRPRGRLRMPNLSDTTPGASAVAQFAWKDLLQADACTTCGRCNEVCPATAAGKPLQPREVVLGLRAAMNDQSTGNSIPLSAFIPDDVIWSCTTCGACNAACPVGIEIFDKIIELRRGRVEQGEVPEAAETLFEGTSLAFNPFGKAAEDRLAWAAGMNVPVAAEGESFELLYWVGCAGSFDPDGQAVSRAMVKILDHLGVKYRVLGKRERCTGDPARRMGEEGLFQELARHNIARFGSHHVQKVLTHCPHCFNTFKNEYPELGAKFEVEHHSEFLARMVREDRLKLPRGGADQTITFHDPCYLGRANAQTQAPRVVLNVLPSARLVEMPRSGENSSCCGAGGGSMWLDVKGADRVENLRAKEAAATGATTIATGCPFCKSMLKAGVQSLDPQAQAPQVRDLAELIVEAEGL